jgi:hypothetical protein
VQRICITRITTNAYLWINIHRVNMIKIVSGGSETFRITNATTFKFTRTPLKESSEPSWLPTIAKWQRKNNKTSAVHLLCSPLDRLMIQISSDHPFPRARTMHANLSNTFGKPSQRTPVQLPAFEVPGSHCQAPPNSAIYRFILQTDCWGRSSTAVQPGKYRLHIQKVPFLTQASPQLSPWSLFTFRVPPIAECKIQARNQSYIWEIRTVGSYEMLNAGSVRRFARFPRRTIVSSFTELKWSGCLELLFRASAIPPLFNNLTHCFQTTSSLFTMLHTKIWETSSRKIWKRTLKVSADRYLSAHLHHSQSSRSPNVSFSQCIFAYCSNIIRARLLLVFGFEPQRLNLSSTTDS